MIRRKKRKVRKNQQAINLDAAFKLAERVDPILVELMIASLQRTNKAV